MSIDSNPYENYFERSTLAEQKGFWDTVIDSGSQIVGSLPSVVDGIIDSAFNPKEETQVNENITSKDPAVSGNANQQQVMPDNTGKYILMGVGGLLAVVIVAKVL